MPASRDAAVLYVTHPSFSQHQTGPFHPERTARLRAVEHGVRGCRGPDPHAEPAPRRTASCWNWCMCPSYLDAVERFCRAGGGHLDPDTVVVPTSWEAALRAAGAGPAAVAEISASDDLSIAFLALRPPGHHATPNRAMGFCLINNIGVTAGLLASQGARVAIVDWDVHHGNGTQAMFYGDPRRAVRQHPPVPVLSLRGSGRGGRRGSRESAPPSTSRCRPGPPVMPTGWPGTKSSARSSPSTRPIGFWSAPGYDAHAEDPLAELRLEAGDFGWMASRLA